MDIYSLPVRRAYGSLISNCAGSRTLKMKLHAGSLYKNYLVLYGESDDLGSRIIQIDDKDLQWDIYCNDVEFDVIDSINAKTTFNGVEYTFPYRLSHNPIKDLGFGV